MVDCNRETRQNGERLSREESPCVCVTKFKKPVNRANITSVLNPYPLKLW